MATAAVLADLQQGLDALRAKVAAIETDVELQAELEGVNAQLEAVIRAVRIALSVAADESRPVGERVVLIQETLQETQE